MARSAFFREERLGLFAAALAAIVQQGEELEAGLIDELRQLCTSANVEALNDDIVEVGGDIFIVDPELALQLVERFGRATKGTYSLDWIIAVISMRHAVRGRKSDTFDSSLERIHERIQDPKLRSLSQGIGLLRGSRDADWILERCGQIGDPVGRLTVLRLWLELNGRSPEAGRVAAFALDLAVKTREYSVTVPVLRQFAAPLPYVSDSSAAEELIGRIDALLASVPQRSPSVEYTRLQLLLVRTQVRFKFEEWHSRVAEILAFIEALTDLAVRAECMGRLFAHLPQIDPASDHSAVGVALRALLARVLEHSADHVDVLLPTLKALVPYHPEFTFLVVDEINTNVRRDFVRSELVTTLARSEGVGENLQLLLEQIDRIDDPRQVTSAVIGGLEGAKRTKSAAKLALALWQRSRELEDTEGRARALTLVTSAASGTDSYAPAVEQLLQAIDAIRVPEERAEAGFDAVRELATVDPRTAAELLARVRSDRDAQALGSAGTEALTSLLRLAARSVRGILRSGRDCSEEVQQLLDLCNSVSDVVGRVVALGELCHGAESERRRDIADDVYGSLTRAMSEAKDQSRALYWRCLALAGWAMFVRDERAFVAEINEAPARERERIVGSTVRTIVEGVPPTEPCESRPEGARRLTHKDCTDILALLRLVRDDGLLYHSLRAVSRSATRRDTQLTREQCASIHYEFGELVQKTLPVAEKIRHDGYKWACVAEVMRMDRAESDTAWRELVGYAAQVSNRPDAAYTLVLVASAMLPRCRELRNEAIEKALGVARGVEIAPERCDCLAGLANEISQWDTKMAQAILRECAAIAGGHSDDPEQDDRVDRLLDIAYRISPEFATALGSELDSDAARGAARQKRLSRRTIEARSRMLDVSTDREAQGNSKVTR